MATAAPAIATETEVDTLKVPNDSLDVSFSKKLEGVTDSEHNVAVFYNNNE